MRSLDQSRLDRETLSSSLWMPIGGDFEQTLIDELVDATSARCNARRWQGGWIRSQHDPASILSSSSEARATFAPIAFRRQVLPNATVFDGRSTSHSVDKLVDFLAEHIGSNASLSALPWRLHICNASSPILSSSPHSNQGRLVDEIVCLLH